MSRATQPFCQTDLRKALCAMQAANVAVERIEIGRGGEIKIIPRSDRSGASVDQERLEKAVG